MVIKTTEKEAGGVAVETVFYINIQVLNSDLATNHCDYLYEVPHLRSYVYELKFILQEKRF